MNTAPKRIYLDIGDQFALEAVASGVQRWDLLEGVTWSEDNATSHGIPYVRADLFPTPAASRAATPDDARYAALWREHVAKLDALVTYCPTCCQGFYALPEMTRDEIIFECGKTAGRASQPAAAQPASPAPLTDEEIADALVLRVSEYDDRTSPEDWPEALLITPEELHAEVLQALEERAALASPQVAPAPVLATRPFGFARPHVTPSSPYGPGEIDVDMVYGDDQPEGGGWLPLYLAAPVQVAPAKVYLVATGEVVDGLETYTRHDGMPPPLCDSELLYSAPVAPQDDARDEDEETCDRCNGSGDQEYLVGGGPDAYDQVGPCSKCGGSGAVPAPISAEALIAEIKRQIRDAKNKRVQLAPNFWGSDRGAGLPLSDLEDVILEWESQGGCKVPPPGWWCSRVKGHDGPCAARPVTLSTPAAKPTDPADGATS